MQGDKGKHGELFGIKNIFKLHEGNATQMTVSPDYPSIQNDPNAFYQIERATLTNLDWAFANMKSKTRPTSDLPLDADVKGAGKELGEFKGLETLLFDDSTYCTPHTPQILT